jgi:hypothetical protein
MKMTTIMYFSGKAFLNALIKADSKSDITTLGFIMNGAAYFLIFS